MLDSGFAFTLSIPIYIISLILWIKHKKKTRIILFSTLFYFYIVAVISVTLLPITIDKLYLESTKDIHHLEIPNYVPFTFLQESILQLTPVVPGVRDPFGYDFRLKMVLRQVGGNILLGAPFGFLIPLFWRKRNSFFKVLIAGFWFSIAIEASQFLISLYLGYTYRITDIDDIILNCTGVALGYLCYKIFLPLLRTLRLVEKKQELIT